MAGKPWTKGEDETVLRLYGKVPAAEIASRLGRGTTAVYSRARLLGVGKAIAKTYGPEWQTWEQEFLRVHYSSVNVRTVSACLKRTSIAVHRKAYTLRLGKAKPSYKGGVGVVADCPELLAQWHPTLNGDLSPFKVSGKGKMLVWWQCEVSELHVWQGTPNTRRRWKTGGCPFCHGLRVCADNCLAATHPHLAEEWHPTKNDFSPQDITAGSNRVVVWLCSRGHEWRRDVRGRGIEGRNCPYCTNQRACEDNCLETTHPELAAEWHPINNGNLTPQQVLAGSNRLAWWMCEHRHSFLCKIVERKRSGCPVCQESKGEKAVASCLDAIGVRYSRQRRFKKCRNVRPLPFDFVIETERAIAAIEYQGQQHYGPIKFSPKGSDDGAMKTFHRTQHNDGIKAAFCRDNNIPLLCIPYWDFDRIDELVRTFVATLGAIEPMPQPTPTTPRKSARQRKQLRLSTDTW